MPITYGEAKRAVAQYAGKGGLCPTSKDVDFFLRQVLELLLSIGEHGSIRKFCFNAVKGCFTAPYELESPIKVKIGGTVGNVWSKWMEFHTAATLTGERCYDAAYALSEEANRYPTVYDMPVGGARVGVFATAEEADGATIIIQGKDAAGREIYTDHKGTKVHGEVLTLRKGALRYTTVTFATITEVLKAPTRGYVQLIWIKPELDIRGFLADYAPSEEKPQYKRFKLTVPCEGSVEVSVLGKIRLKEKYADNDLIPFENTLVLTTAAQQLRAMEADQVDIANAKGQFLANFVAGENEHKRGPTSQPVEVMYELSAGTIKNII